MEASFGDSADNSAGKLDGYSHNLTFSQFADAMLELHGC